MPAYERSGEQTRRTDRQRATDPQQARRDLATRLQVLARVPGLIADFAWSAGQLAGAPDADERILGMIHFAMEFQRSGLEAALETVERTSGVPVEIEIPIHAPGEHAERGHIVGIVEKNDRTSFRGQFYGVAVMPNRNGIEDFHAVSIATDGRGIRTQLLPEHLEPEYERMSRERGGAATTQAILRKRLAENHMTDGGPRRSR